MFEVGAAVGAVVFELGEIVGTEVFVQFEGDNVGAAVTFAADGA